MKEERVANKKPNTSKIIALAKQKSYDTEKKVFDTIKNMIREKKVINYNTVSKESKISKSFLYKNDGMRKKIDMLRNEQSKIKREDNNKPNKKKKVLKLKTNTSDKTKNIIIDYLKFKIEQLEKENKYLKEALASKYNDFYKNL